MQALVPTSSNSHPDSLSVIVSSALSTTICCRSTAETDQQCARNARYSNVNGIIVPHPSNSPASAPPPAAAAAAGVQYRHWNLGASRLTTGHHHHHDSNSRNTIWQNKARIGTSKEMCSEDRKAIVIAVVTALQLQDRYTLCLKKMHQLWNGIAQNCTDRFW